MKKGQKHFLEVASYLDDNDDEQITINDLIELMSQKLANTDYDAYGYTYMKTRLEEHFGERIVQTGKPNVITFRTNAGVVLQDYYSKQQQKKENIAEER